MSEKVLRERERNPFPADMEEPPVRRGRSGRIEKLSYAENPDAFLWLLRKQPRRVRRLWTNA